VKFIILQSSPWSAFLPFRSKYPPEHCSQKPSVYVPPSKRETKLKLPSKSNFFAFYECVSKSFRTWSITKYTLITINTRWEATQRVMAAKLTRLSDKIVIQLHLLAESCTICSSRSRRPVRKLLDTPSYVITFLSLINGCIFHVRLFLLSVFCPTLT
jgi:hypothetical protein